MKLTLCLIFASVFWQQFGENAANVVPQPQAASTSPPLITKESAINAANKVSDFWESTGKSLASANVPQNSSYASYIEKANQLSAGWQTFGKNLVGGGAQQSAPAAAPQAAAAPQNAAAPQPAASSSWLDKVNQFSNSAQNLGKAADSLGSIGSLFSSKKNK